MADAPHRIALACAMILCLCGAAVAGDAGPRGTAAEGQSSDPCSFYRHEAYGKGLEHFATEVVWACEAVAERRGAGMPLSDRMRAVEFALERYREAVVAANRRGFAHRPGPGDGWRDARERTREALAAETGILAALEAIRAGF
jgi:hypothetical protein